MAGRDAGQRLATAPPPDDPRKPQTPAELEKRSWKYVFRKTFREFRSDQCTDIAAALTYYGVLSIFPAMVALMSLLGVVGQGDKATAVILSILGDVAPGSTTEVIRGPLERFADSPAAGFGLVAGIVVAIWSASAYVGAFSRAMNRVYEIGEGRPIWKLKPQQILVTIVALILVLIAAIILIISGPVTDAVGSALGIGETPRIIWDIAKWPLLAAVVILIIAMLYYATPNAKQPKFRWMSLGASLALLVLVVATLLFGLYVANFSNYDRTYGSLGGIIVFLLWLWIANVALLFGAEFDAEVERGRQLEAGIAAEENIQLPPRDTRNTEKSAKADREDVEQGRKIREANDKRTR